MQVYAGIDLHSNNLVLALVDEKGRRVWWEEGEEGGGEGEGEEEKVLVSPLPTHRVSRRERKTRAPSDSEAGGGDTGPGGEEGRGTADSNDALNAIALELDALRSDISVVVSMVDQ